MKKFKPEFFGKYLLLEKLAAGGMAEVFLARAPGAGGIGKVLAMKRILPQYSDNQEFIDMFKSEAKIAINLSHSNVVSIYEFGIEDSQLYLTMEYVEGKNIRQLLNSIKKSGKSLSIAQVVYIVKQVADGLDHAHKCIDGSTGKPLNIIHRDMSPQNIMAGYDGEINVVDFGIAKAESQIEKTKAGTLKGKFGYMSPEQAQGLEVDIRTDIFSLGIVLWELLAGERLFIANNEINTLRKIRDCNVPSIKKINPDVPPELEKIVAKSLTKDRNLRYQSCSELFKDLNRFLNTTYPDFSKRDLALFISNIYANEIVEIRSRIVEYSKIPFKTAKQTTEEKSEFLELMTNTSPLNLGKTDDAGSNQTNSSLSNFDFSNARLKSENPFYKNSYKKGTKAKSPEKSKVKNVSTVSKAHQTKTSRHISNKSSTSFLTPLIIIMFMFGGGYLFYSGKFNDLGFANNQEYEEDYNEDTDAEEFGNEEGTSTKASTIKVETIPIVINSKPSGAQIYINGASINDITPASVEVPLNAPFDLKLVKKHYIDLVKKKYKITNKSTRSINNTLQVANIAYLNIDIRPQKDVKIYINGDRLTESVFPINNYAVSSGKSLVLKAINPYNNITRYKKVYLKNGQKKSIVFDLTRPRKPSNNR